MSNNEPVTIERALPEQFREIAKLDRVAWNGDMECPDGVHAWRVWCEHAVVFVALQGGRVVGVALLFRSEQEPDCYFLHKLFVTLVVRWNGVGRRLMEVSAGFLDERRVRCLLTTSPDNDVMSHLCSLYGFVCDSRLDDYYGPGKTRLLLSRMPVPKEPDGK